MNEFIASITSEGQVTIPLEIREYLGIKLHDKIAFVIEQDGIVRLRVPSYPTIASLRGAAGSLPQPISWQDMQRIAYEDR